LQFLKFIIVARIIRLRIGVQRFPLRVTTKVLFNSGEFFVVVEILRQRIRLRMGSSISGVPINLKNNRKGGGMEEPPIIKRQGHL
uniref:Ovule protein n=1 Tax=Haemonchus placei TaxID=6290 RepID=A0A0N4WIX0_HAEPC